MAKKDMVHSALGTESIPELESHEILHLFEYANQGIVETIEKLELEILRHSEFQGEPNYDKFPILKRTRQQAIDIALKSLQRNQKLALFCQLAIGMLRERMSEECARDFMAFVRQNEAKKKE